MTGSRPGPARNFFGAALIFALVLAIYWPALRGGLLWDDDAHVTKPQLQSVQGLGRIWTELGATQQYYPVLHSAFWVEHRLWGDATLGYHLVNILLHASSACLLVLVLRRLSMPGAYIAGLIFALHPVCVESVAWISEQKNTLSTVFFLSAALVYLRGSGDPGRRGKPGLYAAATVLFILALLSKSVTATLPAALLLVRVWQQGRLSWKRDVLPLIPWFGLGAGAGLLTGWVERTYIGAHGSDFALGAVQRGLLAGRIIWFYLAKLLWPSNLIFVYPHWNVRAGNPAWWLPLLTVLAVTAALLKTGGKAPSRDDPRPAFGNWARACLFAWIFFCLTLFPALGFINVYPFVYSYVADHFQYLALIGIVALAGSCWGAWDKRWAAAPGPWRQAPRACAAAMLLVLGGLSRAQSAIYSDLPTLYRTTIGRNPGCWMAYNNLGVYERDHGNLPTAIADYESALRLRPDYAEAHNNLGDAWSTVPGRMNDAIAEYRTALRLKPDYSEAHNNLGNAWAAVPGHMDAAIAEYKTALRLRPDYAEAHNNLGSAWSDLPGHVGDAIAEYQAALRARPNYAEAHNNLANAWIHLPGRLNDALAEYEQALRFSPDNATTHLNLAITLLGIPGRTKEAVTHLQAVLRLQPGNEKARQMLSRITSSQP